ncbi:geranylgeranylglycerol-phosphate geranylgeranyltransferase [Salegentibacter sediminis]|uniref:geranylgeranylglycerol-phosphate geranylgeranyltransferase n=1 Tax=Salegentibacter sediminis TaxID=1930251 RepID=UPI0009C10333|nr:geranylgeranylglycerol-phosphate geranylgeranyltransferase [Salegentibacter sediminis]
MRLLKFLKLIRFGNLVFVAVCLLLIRYAFFESTSAAVSLSDFGYALLIIANLSLAAAGYIINDIYDVSSDRINKPKKLYIGNGIAEKTGFNWFISLNIIGVGIGFYLANVIGLPAFSALFIFSSALLYIYSSYLKNVPLAGNIAVSFLVAGVAALPGIFDLLPAINEVNREQQAMYFSILLDYSFFGFFINLLREMVKDQEDLKGDYNSGGNTLPIILGTARTNKVIFAIGLIPLGAIVYYVYSYLFENTTAVLYVLFLILGPMLFFMVQIWTASEKKDFTRLSLILKIILFFGLISIGFHQILLR